MINRIEYNYPQILFNSIYPKNSELSFQERSQSAVDSFFSKRHKAEQREINRADKLKAGVGSLVGTFVPLYFMVKKHNKQQGLQNVKNLTLKKTIKDIMNLKYELKDMILLSASSITGSLAFGMLGENQEAKKNKAKEGVFQFLNASVPAWVVGGGLKLCESSKNYNNIPGKMLAVGAGLLVGMYGAASLSNVICDPHDKVPDRKLTLLDCIANIDDAIGALVLAKFPLVDKIHFERALPFIYTYCGYRAGKSN